MDPMTMAALSAGFNLLGSISQVNAQNQAALNNAAMARRTAAYKQDQEMESYVEYNRQLLMTAMDRALTARSNTDLAFVSMFETGGGGQVMTDMIAERNAVEARNIYRDRLERTSLKIQTNRNLKGYEEEAKGRIAQVPMTSLNMGHIASAASAGLKYMT
ncbi:hypothetical protein CRP403_gp32 [Roseobacter phage CRP-403]|uniref:Internal virion protein n=1 Tax=Roseobacter phage CRP-403 TaxID=3072849 RepID=A0AAX3ZXQ8_9CAUD|nr:hypothetical protein CRP403_gp32 [Roseobacter phage CRP-403]